MCYTKKNNGTLILSIIAGVILVGGSVGWCVFMKQSKEAKEGGADDLYAKLI